MASLSTATKDLHNARGFNCEFVEPPPQKILQTKCPVCTLILRDPYQVTCCGTRFCLTCTEQIRVSKKHDCSAFRANDAQLTSFHDKGHQHSLYHLCVYCSHKRVGCEWTGELGQLDEHLNQDPQPGKEFEGCQFVPLHCPNKCGLFPQRQKINNHVNNECLLTTINCDFHHVGCTVRLPRKDMPEHLNRESLAHMSLQVAKQQAEISSLKDAVVEQQVQIANLKYEKDVLKSKITNLEQNCEKNPSRIPEVPIATVTQDRLVLAMHRFGEEQSQKRVWFSPPFCTHHEGYKICLGVYPNGYGSGKDTHVSVYVFFVRGENDDSLKWPFRGVITFQLLDQVYGTDHIVYSVIYDYSTDNRVCSRVQDSDRAEYGRGPHKFVAHGELSPKYLQNDSLKFQILSIQLRS